MLYGRWTNGGAHSRHGDVDGLAQVAAGRVELTLPRVHLGGVDEGVGVVAAEWGHGREGVEERLLGVVGPVEQDETDAFETLPLGLVEHRSRLR
jgi:hypothetical protein